MSESNEDQNTTGDQVDATPDALQAQKQSRHDHAGVAPTKPAQDSQPNLQEVNRHRSGPRGGRD